MKIMSKYGATPLRCSLLRKGVGGENQSCRSQSPHDTQNSRLDSLFDERAFEASTSDKACVFPKEKFYGNAQLLLTMNDDVLRKTVIDCDDDSYGRLVDAKYNSHRNLPSTHRLTKNAERQRHRFSFKSVSEFTKPSSAPADDNKMIDDDRNNCKAAAMTESDFLSNRERNELSNESSAEERMESETPSKAFAKSSSFPVSFQVAQYSLCKGLERAENLKARGKIRKSVSTLSVRRALKGNAFNEENNRGKPLG